MIRTIVRGMAGTLAGFIVALIVVIGVEGFSAVVHPVPTDFGGTMEEMCRHVERYPTWVLAAAVPMWAFAALAATWVARRIGNLGAAGIVGLLLIAALAFNLSELPYPIWFKAATLLAIPAALTAGAWLARGQQAAGPAEAN